VLQTEVKILHIVLVLWVILMLTELQNVRFVLGNVCYASSKKIFVFFAEVIDQLVNVFAFLENMKIRTPNRNGVKIVVILVQPARVSLPIVRDVRVIEFPH
jgi:hypothetical protein